jgi:cytochrome c-type biogenesis protein CcmH
MKSVPVVLILLFSIWPATMLGQNAKTTGSLRVPDAAQFVGQPQGAPLEGDALYQRAQEVSSLLRCPVCQGMAVADSPAEMAVNMKHQVRELLARGYTEEQILRYFELSYGQFVLLRPKFEGVNRLVWLLPFLGLAAGAVVIYFAFRRLRRQPVGNSPVDVTSAAVESEDPYVARVRELVSGGKK